MEQYYLYLIIGGGALLILLVVGIAAWYFFAHQSFNRYSQTLVSSQRGTIRKEVPKDAFARVSKEGIEGGEAKAAHAALTVEKKLKYAQWTISRHVYYTIAAVISIFLYSIVVTKLHIVFHIIAIISGPMIMNSILMFCVNRRFKKFDKDYASYLLSLVGLLKTGMNTMQALSAAASSLEEGSVLRVEVEVMLEQLRMGVSEERSIGAFGEDIYHSEIELFVEALLLSRKLGGVLSDTLDRLARQVRRRQYFREQAVAAVGMQRGSIKFIIGILCGLQGYIYMVLPSFVDEAIKHEVGWQVWQFGLLLIIVGFYWAQQVTKIRV